MRVLNTSEVAYVSGGILDPTDSGYPGPTSGDSSLWRHYFGEQLGAPASGGSTGGTSGGNGVTLTPAEKSGLSDTEAAKLIGWIEALGAFTDPETAIESDDGVTGFSAVEQEKTTMAMKMYCTDHGEGWAPGPQGSPGVCTH